jgi:hypothetical protein
MDPCNEKQVEAITSAEVVPDRDGQANTDIERISNLFTIAAAASGLISDGCEFPCTSVPNARFY